VKAWACLVKVSGRGGGGRVIAVAFLALAVLAGCAPDTAESGVAAARSTVHRETAEGPGLHPILTPGKRLGPERPQGAANILIAMLPPMGYGALVLLRHRRRAGRDPGFARYRSARTRARKRLERLDQAEDPAGAVFDAVSGYLADRFDANEAGLTSKDLERLLCVRRIDPDLAADALRVLRSCERQRYGMGAAGREEIGALRAAATGVILRLDRAGRERRRR